ncbi:BamA/TamA family outer membrane protein [Reichenbachiella ulvae]|uniref:BamA/TamA family outer membrane protein n=1 Tax=Reichenbachiella ulvae TaxID=2980104 RepID=A0ABT3CRJ4_9BACT|nr:BamA/TamA family outer membrane protein [Reichenbachiella ulvae]MCV9386292.1 BamA/TamA family outer membrane protein [Reichenbachiella ulvae]
MRAYILTILFTISTYLSVHALPVLYDSALDEQVKVKSANFSLMPYLSYNRNLKFMFGVVPMAMYKLNKEDSISPKSLSGITGVYTSNNSYILGVFNKFYFSEDRWRSTVYVFNGDISSQFFLNDFSSVAFYDYTTNVLMASVGIQRRVIPGLYGGVTYIYAQYDTEYENNISPPTSTETSGLEINAQYDYRNDVYYPSSGRLIDAKWIHYSEWLGNEAQANRINAFYNTYFPIRDKKDVLAARFSGFFGLGSIPFEQQTIVGGTDLRGYAEGKYRGDIVVALQAEYRLNLARRFGLVGFAGLATLYGSDNEEFNGDLLPGGGVGLRYRAFKDIKFNVGIDAALGKDDWSLNFRIGEAF